ncbi:hypothetical protein PROFUN_03806 [Planoprotostelium fungivorum]|uniref:Uncharacterized protein n=1 Tax=Planoprotostelium fungivorum TaxID=1890364 RepID=A0A2P6NI90_9EUKA|nr:hypothetical protein PROFUN_03806 [Planoprotostelium fungivorum]
MRCYVSYPLHKYHSRTTTTPRTHARLTHDFQCIIRIDVSYLNLIYFDLNSLSLNSLLPFNHLNGYAMDQYQAGYSASMHSSVFGDIMESTGVLSTTTYAHSISIGGGNMGDIIVAGQDNYKPSLCVPGSVCTVMQVLLEASDSRHVIHSLSNNSHTFELNQVSEISMKLPDGYKILPAISSSEQPVIGFHLNAKSDFSFAVESVYFSPSVKPQNPRATVTIFRVNPRLQSFERLMTYYDRQSGRVAAYLGTGSTGSYVFGESTF